MPETLGARLRRRREERGIALAAIAQQTKIKEALLDALEKDDVSQWPASVYRRAFVRAYARAVALDPEVVVQEFLQTHPEPPEVDVLAALASTLDRVDGHARRSIGFRKVVGSAFESLARRQRTPVVDNRGASPAAPSTPAVQVAPEPSVAASPAPVPAATEPAAHVVTTETGGDAVPAPPQAESEPDLLAVARLCTELGRVEAMPDVQPLLEDAARLLDAKGLIVWIWDASAAHLQPALVHGYPEKLVSQLPMVRRDADNPTATAFRSGETHAFGEGHHACGAVVVPLLTAAGCAGVLAIELQGGREGTTSAVALATILAAHLARIPARGLPIAFSPRARLAAGGVSQAV
ncbi:MAG TPA: helix-turn-helix domain-containing protein [Vicinamibacterales bacterium]|nr:helix-turn-helix domain-containing protein [Vicinamibacterales bacterium]